MGTGVQPIDGDFDIDIGVSFHFSKDKHKPVDVKQWVFDALNATANRTVEWKRPCVSVQYSKQGEATFHVDIAVFSDAEYNTPKKFYLAKGYPGSSADNKIWEESDPKKLKDVVENKFTDAAEKAQFRRVIRYLKRWKDENFRTDGNSAPVGIAITALALKLFIPSIVADNVAKTSKPNDLKATEDFVRRILGQFTLKWDSESNKMLYSISCSLPVAPGNDLFERMSLKQQDSLKAKLETLRDCLMEAGKSKSSKDASKLLRKQFGSDFPEGDDDAAKAVSHSNYGA
jgi:hypothetical protein